MSIVNYNGQFYHEGEVPIKFNNRAFKYGDSFFETIRCNGHYPIHFDLHYKRIIKALLSLKMNIASIPEKRELEKGITHLLQKNKYYGASRVRISVFRAGDGLYTPQKNDIYFVIECSKLETLKYDLNSRGLLMGDYTDVKKTYNSISYFKSGNALPYVLAAIAKNEQGVDDCFLYNEQNNIIEATSSNVFFVKDGVFYTPSIFSGCVAGIMREVIMSLIKKADLKVNEINGISQEELYNADEVFICNAVHGVSWVLGYGEKRFFNQCTKRIYALLNESVFDVTGN